jgi:hypothetical protein
MKYQVPVRASQSRPDRPPTVVPSNVAMCGTRCSPRNRVIRTGSRCAAAAGCATLTDATANATAISIIFRERAISSSAIKGHWLNLTESMKSRITSEVHGQTTARRTPKGAY